MKLGTAGVKLGVCVPSPGLKPPLRFSKQTTI